MLNEDLLKAVHIYLDAIYYCDEKLLDQVFHPQSSLFDADQGEIVVDPIANFRADVANRPSPASIQQPRQDEIMLIDFLSKQCALVKVRLKSFDNIFVDHLNFVKVEHGWQIVAKVWHLEGKESI